jgi:hypothetical protein
VWYVEKRQVREHLDRFSSTSESGLPYVAMIEGFRFSYCGWGKELEELGVAYPYYHCYSDPSFNLVEK